MTSLSFAVVLQASVFMTGAETYAEAHKVLTETGTPLAKFACMPEVDQNRVERVSRMNS